MALMLYYDLYISAGEYVSLQQMFNRLSEDDVFVDEVCQLTEIMMSRCNALEQEKTTGIPRFIAETSWSIYQGSDTGSHRNFQFREDVI